MYLQRFNLRPLQREIKYWRNVNERKDFVQFLQNYSSSTKTAGRNKSFNIIRQYSTQNNTMSIANYVQLLPIILPASSNPNGKILLRKWSSGDYEGRYTGIIKAVEKSVDLKSASAMNDLKEYVAEELMPSHLKNYSSKIELVGILRFDGPPESDEYIYLASLQMDYDDTTGMAIQTDEHPCFWFNWDKIPFEEMPADDAIWYPKVLWEYQKVRGSFVFGGALERDIKSYHLSTVTDF